MVCIHAHNYLANKHNSYGDTVPFYTCKQWSLAQILDKDKQAEPFEVDISISEEKQDFLSSTRTKSKIHVSAQVVHHTLSFNVSFNLSKASDSPPLKGEHSSCIKCLVTNYSKKWFFCKNYTIFTFVPNLSNISITKFFECRNFWDHTTSNIPNKRKRRKCRWEWRWGYPSKLHKWLIAQRWSSSILFQTWVIRLVIRLADRYREGLIFFLAPSVREQHSN